MYDNYIYWPGGTAMERPQLSNRPSSRDLHPAVVQALIGTALWLVAVLWIFFVFFAAVFIVTPWILARQADRGPAPARLAYRHWADGDFELFDGRTKARDAAVTVLTAPLAVAVGGSALGFVAYAVRVHWL
jgi:hypothetical protein